MKHAAPTPQFGTHSAGLRPVPARGPRAAIAVASAFAVAIGSLVVGVTTSAQADSLVTGRAIVGFDPGTRSARAVELLASLGIAPGGSLGSLNARVVDLAPGQSQRLARAPGVAYVEPDVEVATAGFPVNDPVYPGTGPVQGGQWGIWRISTPTVWAAIGYGGPTIVAVVDTGVAAAHPDLQGQVLTGRNVLDGSTNTSDAEGHGTSIAGLIAASTNNGVGIAGFCGGCKILPVKVTDSVSASNSDLAAGVTYAVEQGARVINLSFAGPTPSTTLANAVAYARSRGAVVIAAAGNSGCDCTTYPSGYDGVIAVGATSNLSGDPLQGYSNYGAWVDVAAPAGMATTTLTDPTTGAQYGYGGVGGTSLAAPVVAGVAALLLSARPDATGADVERALLTGAATISGTRQVATGRIDALDAYTAITGAASPTPSTSPSPSSSPSATPTVSADPTPTATTSPTPTPTLPSPSPTSASPTPTATTGSPTPTATPTSPPPPSPTPTASPSSTTTVVSASLTRKATSRSYSVVGPATLDLSLVFACPSLTLSVKDPTGATLWSRTGGSVLTGRVVLPAGTSSVQIGVSSKCSFTLSETMSA